METELLFEGTPPIYDEHIMPLVEVDSLSQQSPTEKLRGTGRVYNFYEYIQGLRIGDHGKGEIDERLIQIIYDTQRIVVICQNGVLGDSFRREVNEGPELEKHLCLLRDEAVSFQLKHGVLRYVRFLFKYFPPSDVDFIEDIHGFILSLWGHCGVKYYPS
jgi:hypothetical protein